MLTGLRNASGSLMVKILLGLLVLSFAVWGVSGQIFGPRGNDVLTAGESRVSILDYRLAYDRQIRMLSEQFGTHITREQAQAFGIDQQVLGQLVAGALLDEQAREMRLGMSAERLAQLTREDPAFHGPDGRFDRQQFEWVLRQVGMRPDDYLRNREQVAKRQQIVEAVSDGLAPPDAFLTAVALYQGERRSVDMITLPRSLAEPIEAPEEAELQAWFEENADNYIAPEYRKISYIRLDPDALADPEGVTDDEVEEYYQASIDRFSMAERRRIEQIVFADEEAAQSALERIRGQEDFETIAEEMGRASDDLLLGTFEQDQVPDAAIGQAAFALEEGEVSDVVDGAFGSVLVRVTDIEPAGAEPLEEVEGELRQEMALDRSSERVMEFYDSYEDARAAGESMAEAASRLQLDMVTVEAVDPQGRAPDGETVDLPEADQLLQEAFETEEGIENPPLNIGTLGFLFYEVDEVVPSRQQTLEEVRDRAEADWMAEQRAERLAAIGEEIRSRIEAGEAMEEIAAEMGLEMETKRGLNRNSNDVDLGDAGVSAVFSTPQNGTGIVPVEGERQIVFTVIQVTQPLGAGPDTIDENMRMRFAAGISDDLLDQLVARLQGVYPIAVDQNAIRQALSF